MYINSISENSFDGKIRYDKFLSKTKKDFVEKVLDDPINGSTLRKRISKGSYDVRVFSIDTKRTIHPKVYFNSNFKKLKEKSWERCLSFSTSSKGLRIDTPIDKGAEHLAKFLEQFERYKNYTNYSYNSFGEKMKAVLKKFFGIK